MAKKNKLTQDQYYVVQSNQLARYFRHDMTHQQLNLYYFVASLIKRNDDPETVYRVSQPYIRASLGLSDSGTNNEIIKEIMKNLRDHSQWIRNEKGNLEVVSILKDAEFDPATNEYIIKFHRLIQPHLFNLMSNYTQTQLAVLNAFANKYTSELYMFLLSFFNEGHQQSLEKEFTVQEIKERTNSEDYSRWPDFNRFVLQKAIAEINSYSDCMKVECEPIRIGKKTEKLLFKMEPITDKEAVFNIQARKAQKHYMETHKHGRPRKDKQTEKKEPDPEFVEDLEDVSLPY